VAGKVAEWNRKCGNTSAYCDAAGISPCISSQADGELSFPCVHSWSLQLCLEVDGVDRCLLEARCVLPAKKRSKMCIIQFIANLFLFVDAKCTWAGKIYDAYVFYPDKF
jgi:hypothetical protein